MLKYKLMDQKMQTRDTQWVLGERQEILCSGTQLCSPDVYLYYNGPLTAALMNPILAYVIDPRLFIVECDSVVFDGITGGSKWQKPLLELDLPRPSVFVLTAFVLLCAREVCQNPEILHWIDHDWLAGHDRSTQTAEDLCERTMARLTGIYANKAERYALRTVAYTCAAPWNVFNNCTTAAACMAEGAVKLAVSTGVSFDLEAIAETAFTWDWPT